MTNWEWKVVMALVRYVLAAGLYSNAHPLLVKQIEKDRQILLEALDRGE